MDNSTVYPMKELHILSRDGEMEIEAESSEPQLSDARLISLDTGCSEEFQTNEVSTARYSLLTWAPKSLIWQFRRVANIYFLIISVLTFMPFSPKSSFSMVGTFSAVLVFTMLKEAYEDYFRHKQDKVVNSIPVHVLSDEVFVDRKAKDLKVGDIVEVRENEFIPADLLFLSSSHSKGLAFVNTMNLDGETNLKEKLPLPATLQLNNAVTLSKFKPKIYCDQPNPNMSNWNCALSVDGNWHSMGFKQFLVRGSHLKNTACAYGIVVYTGHDTKIVLNSKKPPSKVSNVFRQMNKVLYTVFVFQISICVLFAALNIAWRADNAEEHTYLDQDEDENAGDFFVQILTFWVAYSHLIPISLYVALEIFKLAQAYLISQDQEMYYEKDDKPANSRSSDLVEELGQVEFVFSDKTGTLTRNEMEFKKYSVNGLVFSADDPISEVQHGFFRLLSVCHSAFPTTSAEGETIYQAPSPDELALVSAAAKVGIKFIERTENALSVYYDSDGMTETWEILAEIPFTSERKRMSILLKDPQSEKICLMTKGADSIMIGLLDQSYPFLERDIYDFAVKGLRTLVMAIRYIDLQECSKWMEKFKAISLSNSSDKEEQIYKHAETLERQMTLVGVSGIEDKLQDGVPETIELLIHANIRVWVLTGDKQETAIEIGKSCNLISANNQVIVLSSDSEEELERKLEEFKHLERMTFQELEAERHKIEKPFTVVVDGQTLTWIIDSTMRHIFFKIGFMSKSCICCRVTPLQKLQVVALAKEHGSWITLSIGDGANDVSMIQEAHIGIGISGKEGTQAVQSSDFAIAQFSFLGTLLLVHGRWIYKRVSWFICFYFYKNIVLVFTEFWFAFYNGFSGQIYFLDWLPMLYNSFWTSWPCMVAYIFEQDVSASVSKQHPHLYGAGQAGVYFKYSIFWKWVALAFWHGIVCYWVPVLGYSRQPVASDGIDTGLWWISTLSFTLVIHLVALKLFVETSYWTLLNIAVAFISVLFYHISVLVLCSEDVSSAFQPEAPWLFMNLLASSKAWLGILFLPLLALVPDLIFVSFFSAFKPTPTEYLARRLAN